MELTLIKMKNAKKQLVSNTINKINENIVFKSVKNNEKENISSNEQNFLFIICIIIALVILFWLYNNF